MADSLVRVQKAARAKRKAGNEYSAALTAAVVELERAGAPDPYSQVAKAAGVTRQAVRQLRERG